MPGNGHEVILLFHAGGQPTFLNLMNQIGTGAIKEDGRVGVLLPGCKPTVFGVKGIRHD